MDEKTRDGGRGVRSRRGSCWTMSTASQASRSGPIDSKRVCSTLKSRSLLPFLSLPSIDRHHSFSLPLIPTFCLSFTYTRALIHSLVLDVNDAMGGGGGREERGDTAQQIRNPLFLNIKLRFPFFGFDPPHRETSRRYSVRAKFYRSHR